MLNHSCLPNATWVFKGRELQVRAETDLTAGEELTISYIGSGGFKQRQKFLETWGIKCSCPLCLHGDIEPSGGLGVRLDAFMRDKHLSPQKFCGKAMELIREVKEESYSQAVWPMRELQQKLYEKLQGLGDLQSALTVLLKIKYAIEPYQTRPSCMAESIESSKLIVVTMGKIYKARDSKKMEDVGEVVAKTYVSMCAKALVEIETCYGKDSFLAVWERRKSTLR